MALIFQQQKMISKLIESLRSNQNRRCKIVRRTLTSIVYATIKDLIRERIRLGGKDNDLTIGFYLIYRNI
jgi:hypothetical protein